MKKNKTIIDFPDDLMKKFREIVVRHSGLYFKDQGLKNLKSSISARMEILGISVPAAYYLYLSTSKEREEEFRELRSY